MHSHKVQLLSCPVILDLALLHIKDYTKQRSGTPHVLTPMVSMHASCWSLLPGSPCHRPNKVAMALATKRERTESIASMYVYEGRCIEDNNPANHLSSSTTQHAEQSGSPSVNGK